MFILKSFSSSFLICLCVGGLLLNSCTKDRFPENQGTKDSMIGQDTTMVKPHSIFINEIVAKGSNLTSDLGISADWVELYNPSNTVFTLKKNRWYLSDDTTELDKFQITTDILIQPKSYLILFCDDSSKITPFIHTNFGLSSGGDNFFVSYKQSDSNLGIIDSKSFGPQESNISIGRSPDGSNFWTSFPNPTPGQSNN
jgi:hypothetical protein